jgi:hypothetical protein
MSASMDCRRLSGGSSTVPRIACLAADDDEDVGSDDLGGGTQDVLEFETSHGSSDLGEDLPAFGFTERAREGRILPQVPRLLGVRPNGPSDDREGLREQRIPPFGVFLGNSALRSPTGKHLTCLGDVGSTQPLGDRAVIGECSPFRCAVSVGFELCPRQQTAAVEGGRRRPVGQDLGFEDVSSIGEPRLLAVFVQPEERIDGHLGLRVLRIDHREIAGSDPARKGGVRDAEVPRSEPARNGGPELRFQVRPDRADVIVVGVQASRPAKAGQGLQEPELSIDDPHNAQGIQSFQKRRLMESLDAA